MQKQREYRQWKCTRKTCWKNSQVEPYTVSEGLRDIKKMIKDVKEPYSSELEKLTNEVTEFKKELEIKGKKITLEKRLS